jgi:hypothetical protein
MPRQLVECVPNFSEGRDAAKVDAIVRAVMTIPQVALLDRESAADHNRSVLTFAGPPDAVADAALRAVEKAAAGLKSSDDFFISKSNFRFRSCYFLKEVGAHIAFALYLYFAPLFK